MPINIDLYLAKIANSDSTRYDMDIYVLYSDLPHDNLQKLFASIHTQLNESFTIMNKDIGTGYNDDGSPKYSGGYFHAQDSRDLLALIEQVERLSSKLSGTQYAFTIHDEYSERIRRCKRFVANRNGSIIPDGLPPIELVDFEPIFILTKSIPITRNLETIYSQMRSVGNGSYAKVFSYSDPFYGMEIALKRANDDLDEKELERFRQEFNVLKGFKSPYIVSVYSFNDVKNEYTMEYMDETIYDYIRKRNQSLPFDNRKRIIGQICTGLNYIHGKGYLHRDISLKNVMIKIYDDVVVVKIVDFGLIKSPESTLTSLQSEMKGSLNDPDLVNVGFGNYEIRHETFALTRLCFYVLTGRTNVDKQKEGSIKTFWSKGTSPNLADRFASVDELWIAVKQLEQE